MDDTQLDRQCVALYARVSSQRQADEMTIASQLADIKERIAQDGLRIDDDASFIDDGYTGAVLVRPALERLRDLSWAGGLDRLYVHSPDRLARKYAYQVVLLDEFQKHGVEVIFLNHDPKQHDSAEGDLLLQVQGIVSEYERAKILERTRRGKRFAARQGKVTVLSGAPFGYRYVPKQQGDGEARWDLVLEEAQLVKEMFTWVGVEGLSLGEVSRQLEERQVLSPKGNVRWDPSTVRCILLNRGYTGTAKYGKTRLSPRKPGRRPKRGDPAIPRQEKVARPTLLDEQESIAVPAIVSQELFDTVAEQLEENRRRQREQKKGAEHLLSGLLVCQQCGSAYCGRRQRRRSGNSVYVYYRCVGTDKYRYGGETICSNKSLNAARLESSVWSDVCSLLSDPGRLQRELQRRLECPRGAGPVTNHLEESITGLKRRMSRLIDAYEAGWLDKSEFEPRVARVKERLSREQESLSRVSAESTAEEELRLTIGHFESFAEGIQESLTNADFATQRKLLRMLIKRIEVDESEVRIVYKVQPHPFVSSPAKRGAVLQDCLMRQGRPFGTRVRISRAQTGGDSAAPHQVRLLTLILFLQRWR